MSETKSAQRHRQLKRKHLFLYVSLSLGPILHIHHHTLVMHRINQQESTSSMSILIHASKHTNQEDEEVKNGDRKSLAECTG